ncbi:hypothetical protein RFI_17422, partial [Reticulomyxa filosa]
SFEFQLEREKEKDNDKDIDKIKKGDNEQSSSAKSNPSFDAQTKKSSTHPKFQSLLQSLVRRHLCRRVFADSVYDIFFMLLQNIHGKNDALFQTLAKRFASCQIKDYGLPAPLQVDEDEASPFSPLSQEQGQIAPFVHDLSDTISTHSQKDNHTIPPSSMQKPITLSVLQPCLDQFAFFFLIRDPLEKIECLLKFKESLITCIDEYRYHKHLTAQSTCEPIHDTCDADTLDLIDPISEDKALPLFPGDVNIPPTQNKKTDLRTHGGFEMEDVNVSLLSVSSDVSDNDPQNNLARAPFSPNGNKPSNSALKQVLIGGDDMIPLFAYCLIKSQLSLVHSEIAFIDIFLDEEIELTEAGSSFSLFCFFTMKKKSKTNELYISFTGTLQVAVQALRKGTLPIT